MGIAMKVAAPMLLGAMVMASVASTDVASAGTFNPALTTQHGAQTTPVWWRGGYGWHRGFGYRGFGYRGFGYRVGYGWGGRRWCYWHPRACGW